MLTLKWVKCQGDVWCRLETVNLSHSHFDNMYGVYIIWHGAPDAWTVYVGQGFVRDRLAAHRGDNRIQVYSNMVLYVTWASVQEALRDGVENYLAGNLGPRVGEQHPDVSPIEVNLPW